MDLHEKIRTLPTRPGVYLYRNAAGRRDLRRQSQKPSLPGTFLPPGWSPGQRQDRLAHARGRGRRLHPGGKRTRGAGARKQPHQAAQAALQHPAARRQDLPLRQADPGRPLPQGLCDPQAAQGRKRLLRTLLSRQPGASGGRPDPPQLSAAQLQGRSVALPSPALPAVLHQALPGTLRRRPHHARGVPAKRCATRRCSWKAGRRS